MLKVYSNYNFFEHVPICKLSHFLGGITSSRDILKSLDQVDKGPVNRDESLFINLVQGVIGQVEVFRPRYQKKARIPHKHVGLRFTKEGDRTVVQDSKFMNIIIVLFASGNARKRIVSWNQFHIERLLTASIPRFIAASVK